MLNVLAILFLITASLTLSAQDITGQWNGVLKVQGIQLRLVFHVSKTENGYTSTMDSPDQGANDISVTNTEFENPNIKFEVVNLGIEYTGELNEDEIVGTFRQRGQEFPMNLSREEIEKVAMNRPQEPQAPFSYYTEDVVFENTEANISLSGTLTLPKKEGTYPVVILISGSGPQNRNEEILGHKPFLVLADHFTNNGIGVLRYDDRGVGESTGKFELATSVDLATDVESAINYLKTRKEVDKNKIGLVGHSEGGLIAPMVADNTKDVDFIVLLAGPGIPGDEILVMQQKLISKANGSTDEEVRLLGERNASLFKMVKEAEDTENLEMNVAKKINELIEMDFIAEFPNGMSKEDFVNTSVKQLTGPWMRYFISYDPQPNLSKVKCPILAVIGEKDLQVPAKVNLEAIEKALKKGKNKDYTVKELANLNHLFQECDTGSPSEYAVIEETFSPTALNYVTEWIINHTR